MITYELPPPATSAPAASRCVPSGQVTVTSLSEELDALLALTICRFGTAADAGPGALVTTARPSRTVLTNAAGHRMNSRANMHPPVGREGPAPGRPATSALGAADAAPTTECDPAISVASQLDPGVLDGP